MPGRVVADRLVRDRSGPAQLLGPGHPERSQDLILDEGAVLFPGPLLDELAEQVVVRAAVRGLRPGGVKEGSFAMDSSWACQGRAPPTSLMPLVMSSSSLVVIRDHLGGSLKDLLLCKY